MLDTSSLASRHCSSMLSVSAPDVTVHLLRHDASQQKWESTGSIATDLVVDIYKAPTAWEKHAAAQQMFLKEQDVLTERIWYMYRDERGNSGTYNFGDGTDEQMDSTSTGCMSPNRDL